MSDSCCDNSGSDTVLEIGKEYVHSNSESRRRQPEVVFVPIKQWNTNLFMVEMRNNGRVSQTYLMTSAGTPLGFAGWSGSALNWSIALKPPEKNYEVRLLSENGFEHDTWFPLYMFNGTNKEILYVVRENGNHMTSRTYTGEEFKEFKRKARED